MGSRLLVKKLAAQGTVWTQMKEAAAERGELEVPTHLMFKAEKGDRKGQSEKEGGRQEGRGVGQEERINSSWFNRGVL